MQHSQTGVTLVEIIVVIVILSVFASIISLSVGSSDTRKNRAFYEHLTDSLGYVRLLSAERMQPMGLSLQADHQGQVTPVIVMLSNPYSAYQTQNNAVRRSDSMPKNAMELSANIAGLSAGNTNRLPIPSWDIAPQVPLQSLPAGVSISIQNLDSQYDASQSLFNNSQSQSLQPWFNAQTVPQVLWFGTGQATSVTIEVHYQSRLVGEVITIMPDGSIHMGQG